MPVAGGGFDQCYNAQAAVAAGNMLVVAADVVQAPNDKQQIEPTLDKLEALPEALGETGDAARGRRLFQRSECRSVREGGRGAGDRDGPPAAPSASGRALRQDAGGAGQSDTGRGDGASAERRRKVAISTPCANRRLSRCSASSNPVLGFRPIFDARTGKGARRSGDLVTMAWNIKRECSPSIRPEAEPVHLIAPQTVPVTAVRAVSPRSRQAKRPSKAANPPRPTNPRPQSDRLLDAPAYQDALIELFEGYL